MNSEAKLISAVCQNKDISTLFTENVNDLFTDHADIWDWLVLQYSKYGSIPDVAEVETKFRDFDPIEPKAPTKYYLDELKDTYVKSKLQAILLDKGRKLGELPGEQVLQELAGELSGLNKLTSNVRDLDLTDFESAEKHYELQRQRSEAMGGSPGIPTGFDSIDANYRTGMAPGHLMVLIGWPGRGKTWFSSYLACKAWERGFKPMIVSLEMSPEGMRDRIYTLMASGLFRNSQFSGGDINVDSFRGWATDKFKDKQSFVVVSNEGVAGVTPNTVQAKIDQHKPDLVICDYHQLFDDNAHSKSEVERNRRVSRELKLLAVNNHLPVIDITAATMDDVSSQDEPPMLSQVAWSKAIEYDADIAMAVHKERDSNLIQVISRKNRHGGEFAVFLDWDIDQGIVKEVFGSDG